MSAAFSIKKFEIALFLTQKSNIIDFSYKQCDDTLNGKMEKLFLLYFYFY